MADLVCARDGWFLSRDYDFLLFSKRCGTLEWERGFRPRALAETGETAWWIERRGLGAGHAMLVPGAATNVATVRRRLFRSTAIVLADGRTYEWGRARAFSLRLSYGIRHGGEELLGFREEGSFWQNRVRIHVGPASLRGLTPHDRAILIVLGTYLYLSARRQQAWA
ncbi:MAG: hypothetical protein ACHQX4_05120 [Gemmatimonadales bacterium]